MRVFTQTELMRMTKPELQALLCWISGALPGLRDGSPEARAAHANIQAIRRVLVRPAGPAP